MPALTTPLDWTSWRTRYDGYISATFVKTSDPETEAAIKAAFDNGSIMPHVAAINALQRVPLNINTTMIPLLEKFAGDEYRRDVKVAQALAAPLWNCIRCDRRGRLIQLCDFSYTRGDAVGSLFLFANGKKLGAEGLDWLKIAVADAYGFKGTWAERRAWADGHHEFIKEVAAGPGLVWLRDIRKDNGKPRAGERFLFVAACKEYISAEKRGAKAHRQAQASDTGPVIRSAVQHTGWTGPPPRDR
jgi:DNA-directed RNA polymerase